MYNFTKTFLPSTHFAAKHLIKYTSHSPLTWGLLKTEPLGRPQGIKNKMLRIEPRGNLNQ